ncbi:methionyl-tRNA formyltransferase [Winogradskyella sp. DF17]|uniref:Methionyl-tRNA formyltransferase n=1 Tax=Winogradskyella pelagia TaxID=2819984 RepID=A0ABS3SXL6_9FLAO|nr:methionyl-tRNA formyltransferase [Winogradskyella sp. DF17]MBO3115232.1 methionyl-tRNA formyltransferase [Winogradskyella sp. DF17]
MLNLGILCSGDLGLITLGQLTKTYTVQFVLTDRNSKGIIRFSEQNNIPVYAGNPRGGKGYNFIKQFVADVIISINYIFLIEEDIINHAEQLTFNLHGSLLPKYRGRTPHVWSIINGEKEAGITAHRIDSGCDTGDVIKQVRIPIGDEETGADILKKYKQSYYPLILSILQEVSEDGVKFTPQDEGLASYFGKRTPEDGEIDWSWNSEAIRNWVRAQAFPYPGAFTFMNGQKVVIDKVGIVKSIEQVGVNNGEVVATTPVITVKTPDAYITLDVIRTENITFEIGNILGNEYRE